MSSNQDTRKENLSRNGNGSSNGSSNGNGHDPDQYAALERLALNPYISGELASRGVGSREYDDIAQLSSLTSSDKILLGVIDGFVHQSTEKNNYPSQALLARAVNGKYHRVANQLRRLVRSGLVTASRKSRRQPYRYDVTFDVADRECRESVEGFTKMPVWLRTHATLTACEKRILAYAYRHAGQGEFVSLKPQALSQALGISRRHALDSLSALFASDWLERTSDQGYSYHLVNRPDIVCIEPKARPASMHNKNGDKKAPGEISTTQPGGAGEISTTQPGGLQKQAPLDGEISTTRSDVSIRRTTESDVLPSSDGSAAKKPPHSPTNGEVAIARGEKTEEATAEATDGRVGQAQIADWQTPLFQAARRETKPKSEGTKSVDRQERRCPSCGERHTLWQRITWGTDQDELGCMKCMARHEEPRRQVG